MIGFGDLAIGISLSLGLFTRLGGTLAIVRAVTNILVAGGAGADTVGFNTCSSPQELLHLRLVPEDDSASMHCSWLVGRP